MINKIILIALFVAALVFTTVNCSDDKEDDEDKIEPNVIETCLTCEGAKPVVTQRIDDGRILIVANPRYDGSFEQICEEQVSKGINNFSYCSEGSYSDFFDNWDLKK